MFFFEPLDVYIIMYIYIYTGGTCDAVAGTYTWDQWINCNNPNNPNIHPGEPFPP